MSIELSTYKNETKKQIKFMQKLIFKNSIKIFAIIFIAVIGLFVFSQSAEAAFSCDSGSTSTTDSDIGPGG